MWTHCKCRAAKNAAISAADVTIVTQLGSHAFFKYGAGQITLKQLGQAESCGLWVDDTGVVKNPQKAKILPFKCCSIKRKDTTRTQ